MSDIETTFQTLVNYVEGELGDIARNYFFGIHSENTQKYDGSVVTEVDAIIEKKLKLFIKDNFPDDAIYGEEEGFVSGTSKFVWVIDPIDGTDNFVRKIPFFAITVARLGEDNEGTFSIIYNPASRQIFSAFENIQLCENGVERVGVTQSVAGRNFVTVTGTNSSAPWIKMARQNLQKALYREFGKSGHYHSSLLEHAYVATGKLEGLLQIEMNAWDSAAGVYLVLAGGGVVSVFSGDRWVKHDGPVKDLYGADFSIKPSLFVSYEDIHERALALIGDPKEWTERELK